ncbi:MAG: bifunctional transaldolase/phosoglucose isomerase [Anaerolineales bacterium]
MNPVLRLHELGQSVWLDYIRRDLLESGQLSRLIAAGEVRGITSNPTIFEHAIAKTDLYTEDIRRMAQAGRSAEQIMDALTLADIRHATDQFRPVYESSDGGDGFVSIEVSPTLARNSTETLEEARRLWSAVNRPNVMVKIPATAQGIPAIEQAIAEGININITLIFSLDRYGEVIEAYLRGLERRVEQGASVDHVASVASFFVSRVDSTIDARLDALLREEGPRAERAAALRGKAAVANAKLAYAQFQAAFAAERFDRLRRSGARVQRPLWASTSTKDPAYPDTYYVENLIGPDTVDTLPLATLEAFRDHGRAELTIGTDLSLSQAQLAALETLGISMAQVTDHLEKEGVDKFAASHEALLESIRGKAEKLRAEIGGLAEAVQARLREATEARVAKRLWVGDPALWTARAQGSEAVQSRLGWLRLPDEMETQIGELSAAVEEIRKGGFERAILLGMGGSSLAAEVMRKTFPDREGIELEVLDSTDPQTVSKATRRASPGVTLTLAVSKSGSTAEVEALLSHFWERAVKKEGERAGASFVAITDPGTPLESTARQRGFRAVIPGPVDVGGRYSALSVFGLMPALLLGLDVHALLQGAGRMAEACRAEELDWNPGIFLGAVLAAAAAASRDKVTLLADPPFAEFGIWAEQLMAESSGKSGHGLIPVVGEPPPEAGGYGSDRLLVYLRVGGELDVRVQGWAREGTPLVVLECRKGEAGLGAEFFRWEVAVAVACHFLGLNAFDQPDVQSAKDRAGKLVKALRAGKPLKLPEKIWHAKGSALFGHASAMARPPASSTLPEVMKWLGDWVRDGEVLALLLYSDPDPALERAVLVARAAFRDRRGAPILMGWGPRYLHSTGQLLKGGPDKFVSLIVTADAESDVEIPGWKITFGQFEKAQAVGDLQALLARRRRAFGLHLSSRADVLKVVRALGGS